MTKNYDLNEVEYKLFSLDDKIDTITDYISEYRNLTNPYMTDPQVFSAGKESLFDEMFQSIVQNFNTNIISSTTEGTNFNLILENASDAVIEIDKDDRILKVNPASLSILGFHEKELLNKSIYEIISDSYHESYKKLYNNYLPLSEKGNYITEYDIHVFRGKTKYEGIKSFEAFCTYIKRDRTDVRLMIIRDLSFNQSLIAELKESKNNYDALSETISEVIIRIDEKFKIIYANYAVKQVFGYNREYLINKDFKILFPSSEFERYKDEFRKYFYVDFKDRNGMGLTKVIEILGKNKNRGISPMEMSFGNAKDLSGRTLTCIIRDITNRKTIERKLRQLAFHDKLTSLGNRELFDTDMNQFLNDFEKDNTLTAVLFFLDLDGFKQINDTFGHQSGDELLIQTAKRLRRSLRESDSVYRFGGDEFVILIRNIGRKNEAATVAGNVLNEIRKPYTLLSSPHASSITIGVSIGITMIPEDGCDIEKITKNADLAMYKAKGTGKNRYVFFKGELDRFAHERWQLEQGLKIAITNGEIDMYYQPIVDVEGTTKGFEALIRWFHPERGYISPVKYIPIAEETGFIIPMGNWILETACRGLKRINSASWGKDLYVSINLSARQFDHNDLVESIDKVIKRTGIDPSNLRFELTETSIMSAPEQISSVMDKIKERYSGIKFVIDDFGTGYSSLSYLSDLPVDSLKIDISFVSRLFQKNNQKIVNSIINLSESLDLEVVAEGIEEEKQVNYFTEKKCNSLQGFLFSKALSLDNIEKQYS